MHLVYIDEVKHDPKAQQYYWLCGLAIPEEDIATIEASLDEIALDYFGSNEPTVSTEFHAVFIVQGKGPFKRKDTDGRIALFTRLASVIEAHPNIGRIVVRLDSQRISRPDLQTIAFMFFVERVDGLMKERNSKALLIVDHDAEFMNSNVKQLAKYRAGGTDFAFGREIDQVVDTVHHTHSHHSRLLQLADIFVYSKCLCSQDGLKYPRSNIVEALNKLEYFYPSKYKYWPAE